MWEGRTEQKAELMGTNCLPAKSWQLNGTDDSEVQLKGGATSEHSLLAALSVVV